MASPRASGPSRDAPALPQLECIERGQTALPEGSDAPTEPTFDAGSVYDSPSESTLTVQLHWQKAVKVEIPGDRDPGISLPRRAVVQLAPPGHNHHAASSSDLPPGEAFRSPAPSPLTRAA